jgi:hypothetical protein
MEFNNEQTYPTFYPCKNKAEFETLNQGASELLNLPANNTTGYALPIIDKYGKYWFIVNAEVAELVDLTKCKEFTEIEFNNAL